MNEIESTIRIFPPLVKKDTGIRLLGDIAGHSSDIPGEHECQDVAGDVFFFCAPVRARRPTYVKAALNQVMGMT